MSRNFIKNKHFIFEMLLKAAVCLKVSGKFADCAVPIRSPDPRRLHPRPASPGAVMIADAPLV
jgi:hypothetical protein